MERITKFQMESAFKALIKELGGKVAERYDDHGAYTLDHSYGGYQIERICDDSTGVSCPFGFRRFTTKEAYHTFWFAVEAIRSAKAEGL